VDNNDRLWTIKEVADFLNVAEKTVSRMISRDELPAIKIGGQWRFVPERIREWLGRLESQPDSIRDLLRQEPSAVPLDRLVTPDHITVGLEAYNSGAVLDFLAGEVARAYPHVDAARYARSLREREHLASTALGNGIAVPHIRSVEENPPGSLSLFIAITREPVEHSGYPCSVFCLVCTDDLVLHLRLIQKIGYALRDTGINEDLMNAEDAATVLRIVRAAERNKNDE